MLTEIAIVVSVVLVAVALAVTAVFVRRHLRSWGFDSLWSGIGIYFRLLVLVLLIGSPLFLGVGILPWFILVAIIFEGVRQYRRTRQYALLWLLTVSAERSMPLVPAIEAFAEERGGKFGRRAKELARLLNSGVQLPDALDEYPGLLPRYSMPMIRVGHETGTLAHAMRRAATVHDLDEPMWMALVGKIAYLSLVPAIGVSLLISIMLKIVPAFEKIFEDFDTVLPTLTTHLIHASYWIVNYWYLLVPLFSVGPFLIAYIPIRYFGWTDWDLPGMRRFTRRLDAAEILDTLALVAGQQRPLPEGIAILAASYPKRHIRKQLDRAAADIRLGNDWCDSLRKHGLIRGPEFAILQSAQRVGNLPWALTEMADSARRRLAYRLQALTQMLFPPLVILMGMAVLFIVVALFLPLVELIGKLA